MECNCNNNNSNGGVIPWVRGNRLPLIICVYENVVTQEQVGDSTLTVNEMTRVPYEIQDNDTVTVIMKSGFRQVAMPFTTDGNKVMVTDNGELPKGSYTVEVTIERGDGARGRWQETRQVRIYENTSDAQLGEMYSIDADLFFYAKGDTGVGIADITPNQDNTLTITMTDGTTYTTEAVKGEKGDKGDTGERGTSIVSFDVTGQTDVSVIYTVTFSDDTTQDISVPKGPQGDTGLTGNGISSTTLNSDYTLTIAYTDGTTYTTPSIRGAQGAQGVSVIGFTQTGETATNTMYNLVFSDGRTQSVAIPKGTKGDKGDTGNTGAQGAQGPKGDTVTATDYTLYGVQGSDSQGAMSQDATTKAISAQTGYYTCGTISGTAEKVVTVESGNVYKRTLGGHFKVKMTNKNTAASGVTLQIGSETAAALWYNGAAASASNTWEEGEVISVYYDGTYYQASNAQGGGGKAEKIKYDNAQSGLNAENVQEALNEIDDELTIYEFLQDNTITCGNTNARFYAPLTNGMVYKIVIERVSGSNDIGVYAYRSNSIGDNTHVDIGNLLSTENSKEFVWVCNGYQYIGIYSGGSSATAKISIYVGDRKLSDKVANIPETVINFTDIRKAILSAAQAININMDIAVNDIFKVSVIDFGDAGSYTISTWSEADRGGTQLESFTNITDPEKIITIGTAAKCLRLYANGTIHAVLPGNFVVSKATEMSITDAFAYVFDNLSIIPSRETAPSVLSNGMIWLEVGDGMVVHIVSDSVTDTSSTFTDELGNMIVCSSVSKDGDYLSLSSQNSALELPNIVLRDAFSMFMKFKLRNNTQTSCYMALFNYSETAHSQVSIIYNYNNTSSMLQLHIDGVTHNSITLSDTNEHELFLKYENNEITVYLDGAQVQMFAQVLTQPASTINLIGNSYSRTHPCAMDLREFRLYNRAINIEDLDV